MNETPERPLLEQGKGSKFIFAFFISFVIAKILGVAFTKIFTNVLSQEDMGIYTLILSATALIMSFASFGFTTALSRYTIRYKAKDELAKLRNFVFTGFVIFIFIEFLIILGMIIYFLITHKTSFGFNSDNYIYLLLLIAFIVIAQLFSSMVSAISSSLQNSKIYSIVVIMRVLLQIPFGIIFTVFLKLGVFGLAAGLAVSEVIVAIYCGYRVIKDIGIGKFSIKEVKAIIEFGLPVYITGLMWYAFDLGILLFVDNIDNATGKETIALYRYGALTVVNLILLTKLVLPYVYRPIIYKYFEMERFQEMEELSIRIVKLSLIVFFPIASLVYAFSPLLIRFLTQSSYLPSIPIIPVLLIMVLFQYLLNIVSYGHSLYFRNYWNLIIGTISIILAVLTGYFYIKNHIPSIIGNPSYLIDPTSNTLSILPVQANELMGIALAYVVKDGTYFFGLAIVSQRYFKVRYQYKTLGAVLIFMVASIGIGVLFYLFVFQFLGEYNNIMLSFSISAIVFIIGVFITKLIKKDDLSFVYGLFKNYLQSIRIPSIRKK